MLYTPRENNIFFRKIYWKYGVNKVSEKRILMSENKLLGDSDNTDSTRQIGASRIRGGVLPADEHVRVNCK